MTQNPSLYIGIDLGTSGVRACAIDQQKTIQYICKQPLSAPIKQNHRITQDAELWWQATQIVLTELFENIDASQVQSIAVDGTSGTLLVCDQQGNPLSPALMYNDASCLSQARLIKEIASDNTAAQGTCSGLAKLLYLQQHYPNAQHACHQADWIVGKLSGRFDISDANNALKTGYDPVNNCWPAWLAKLSVKQALLPAVVAPGTPIAPVTAGLFNTLNPNCRIVSGTTDSIADFIATGASKPGNAVTSLGSTLVLKIVSQQPIFAAEYGIYSHKLGDYWLAGGASNSGGAVLRQYFSQPEIDRFTAQLDITKPTGLNYYPLTEEGERFPINDAGLPVKLSPRPNDDLEFFQAILEGISEIEKAGYEKLCTLGAPYPNCVESAGGGSKNKAWTKMRQARLGVSVKQAKISDACYGSALLAMSGLQ